MRLMLLVLALPVLLAATPARRSVKLGFFGDVALDDGELVVLDGGIHGVQGHTLRVARDGSARWERRIDSAQLSGNPGAGTFKPGSSDAVKLHDWANTLWTLATQGGRYYPSPSTGVPRWVWAIAIRRGDEIRSLEGGSMAPTDGAPDAAKPVLAWVIATVDGLAEK